MANFCELCGKQIGLLNGYYKVADLKLCDKCYSTTESYEKKLHSSNGDLKAIQESSEDLRNYYKSSKKIEIIINYYLNELHLLPKEETQGIIVDNKELPNEYVNIENEKTDIYTEFASTSSGMFGNIGSKIKTLAQVVTWIGIIGSAICGFVLMGMDEDLIFIGLLIAILGSLSSWVSSFVLYGFGHLIENTDKLIELSKNKTAEK